MSNLVEREREFYDKLWSKERADNIAGVLEIPGVSLVGKRVLVCSCGTGIEPVLAARAGADVYAFDISPVAVENARRISQSHGYQISAEVMDFHKLHYPDEFFDVAYGSYILHHVDCEIVGKELYRILKPGGVAVFWENSDRNPVLSWGRRLVFGSPGGYQKQRFLFMRREGTTDEFPLTDEEVDALRRAFRGNIRIDRPWFCFFGVLPHLIWDHPKLQAMANLVDRYLVRVFPRIRDYSFSQTIRLQKPPGNAVRNGQGLSSP